MLYAVSPPEIKATPEAAAFARGELARLGPMSIGERLMLGVFLGITVLWSTTQLHGIDYAVVALLAVRRPAADPCADWNDVLSDRTAWDVFIWYGGIYQLAKALAGTA